MALNLSWLDTVYFGNTLQTWTIAAAVVVGSFIVLQTAKWAVTRRLAKLADRSESKIDDSAVGALRSIRASTLAVVSLYLGTRALELPPLLAQSFHVGVTLALAFQAGVWANALIERWLEARFGGDAKTPSGGVGYGALRFVARLVAWAAVALVALDNLGVEITTLVAGLGVGGIAVALAVQNILGDVFCSLSILLDKPFEIGDFIVVGDMMGTVENIGVKTTRLRSLGGEQLVFSNSDLVDSRVRNFKRMWQRRILFEFGITYETPVGKVAHVPATVQRIIEEQDDTRFDRVHFKAFGDSALIFEVVYFVLKPDFNVYMDIQQAINLELMKAFAKDGIDFAYPTQTLYVQRTEGAAADGNTALPSASHA